MREANRRLSRAGLILAWGWLALAVGYIAWGSATARGLHGWLMRWQIERSDGYSGTLTFALPLVILATPSLWLLFGHFKAVESDVLGKPERERAYFRGWALALLGAAGLALATAVGCAGMASLQPGHEEPTEIHAAELIAGRAPAGNLVMMGHPELAATYEVTEYGRRGQSRGTSWSGFRPEGERAGSGAPIALFYEGRTSGGGDGDGRLAETIQISGHAVRNGLPDIARRGLEARGVRIAEPHYVLRLAPEATSWMTGFGVALFGAFILAFVGGALLLRANRA